MKAFDRDLLLKRLEATAEWDILIIGGGATGLGLAVDAASRGYKTLLAEQSDFAKGTSSRSTKLVHGGVRYLAQGDVRLVREALKERGLLLQNARHITKNEAFIIPCYSLISGWTYAIGLKMYDWLAGRLSLGKSHIVGKKEVKRRLPTIENGGLKFGVLYHDGTFDDARLAVNLAQTAVEHGATVLNYLKVTTLEKNDNGQTVGAALMEMETGRSFSIRSKVVVNATGVFADEILQMDETGKKPNIRPSQGIHLVLDKSFLQSEDAIMIPRTDDGRVLFAIPWHDRVLIGTTDTPIDSHALEPRALEREIDFIFRTTAKYLSKTPERSDVLSVFAGLRPLAATGGSSGKTKEISRSHKVIVSHSGLISVIGGKWTTYRKMAEDTLAETIKRGMLPFRNCETAHLKIHGSAPYEAGRFGMYGSDRKGIELLLEENPAWIQPVSAGSEILAVQVIWAVRHEMARTVEDVLARRTRLLFSDARAAANAAEGVAALMMDELGRDTAWRDAQVKAFREQARGYMLRDVAVAGKQTVAG